MPLDFESDLEEIRNRIEELRRSAQQFNIDLEQEIGAMEDKYESMARRIFANLTPWQEVRVARHPKRPQTRDYIGTAFTNFIELHGDRAFSDDAAMVTGFAEVGHHRVMLVGEHKGRDVHEVRECHAGCPHPEGYRKALRKMELAERLGLPIITLIDTKGAYPGIGSEERGVAMAIAENLRDMSRFRVPVIVVVIGEGGSGGALGIGVGDRTLMLQHAYYATISPEGCAAILWRSKDYAAEAASALKLTSRDLKEFGLVDEVLLEPLGGAHKNPKQMMRILREALVRHLDELTALDPETLVANRYDRLRAIGEWEEAAEDRLRAVLGGSETAENADAPPTAEAGPGAEDAPEDTPETSVPDDASADDASADDAGENAAEDGDAAQAEETPSSDDADATEQVAPEDGKSTSS